MSKNCPKCGKELPDNAKYCMDCGCSIDNHSDNNFNIFSNGTIFIVLIIIILVVGGVFILTSGFGGNNTSDDGTGTGSVVDLTIKDVNGWDNTEGKKSYTLYTEALFNKVPDDLKGYNVKTTYYDSNGSAIGHETETLSDIYYESDYALSFGFYTTYKLPDPDHVTVEIIKDGKILDSYTEEIDTDKIDYLN